MMIRQGIPRTEPVSLQAIALWCDFEGLAHLETRRDLLYFVRALDNVWCPHWRKIDFPPPSATSHGPRGNGRSR